MKRLFLLLPLLFLAVWLGAATNFNDLSKTITKSSQWVQQFESKTKQGGGYFKYINLSNVAITNIAGYRIKVAGSTTGYFVRSEPLNQFNPAWCGALNTASPTTLAANGWTQAAADAMWGPGLVNVATDGYDQAALMYAFKLCSTFPVMVINMEPKNYYINRTLEIPAVVGNLTVNGNFAYIYTTNSTAYSIISRPQPANLSDAQVQLNATFNFNCLNIAATGSAQVCFQPGPSTASSFFMINTYNGATGMILEMTMDSKVSLCVNRNSTNGFYIKNDDCTGCDNANSNSNMTTVENCRAYQEGTGNIALRLDAIGGAYVTHFVCEGTHYEYGIYVDGKNSTTTRGIYIDNCWWECTTPSTDDVNEAFIYVNDMAAGIVHVTRTKGQYAKVMVHAGNPIGLLTVIVSETQSWAPVGAFWFFNAGTCSWKINYNYQFDSGNSAIVPGTFSTNGGGIVPSEATYGNNTFQYIPR
jgi:hypothetical protein